jgi:DNA-binding LacI/PurR family transcriptional regulator
VRKKVSAADIAKLANVSQSTVSRVFTPGASVSKETKERVLKIAKENNYRPNALARGLIKNKTNMVGLAMKDIQNPFYHEVLGMFTRKLKEKGYSVLFVYTENEEIQQEEINNFLEYNVEGIIVTDALLSSNLVNKLHDNHIPVTFFNRYDSQIHSHSVSCDNVAASREIANYMYEKGYRDIVFIAGKLNTSTTQERLTGFKERLEEKDIDVKILYGDYTYETSFDLTTQMIEEGHIPEAIFGANDITALGSLDALRDKGISVPEETIVIGFDNIKMASWPNYMLSTWSQPIEQMVEETIKLAVEEHRNEPATIKLKGNFIHRGTTME